MALSAFDDKAAPPGDEAVAEVLGEAAPLWDELETHIESRYEPLIKEWGFSGKKYGWSLRLKHRKRAVVYMAPTNGHFLASFAMGQKAIDLAKQGDLSANALQAMETAPKFAEGRGVRIEVRAAADLQDVLALTGAKMAT